jgi:hypothetical protein
MNPEGGQVIDAGGDAVAVVEDSDVVGARELSGEFVADESEAAGDEMHGGERLGKRNGNG